MGHLKGQGYLYGYPEDAATTRKRLAGKSLLTEAPAVSALRPLAGTEARRKAG